MVDIEKLKALAEAANAVIGDVRIHADMESQMGSKEEAEAVMGFMVAANPAAVLELVEEVEYARLVRFLHGDKAALHWQALASDRNRLAAALERVRDQLRAAGATLPAPEPQGTTESALLQGLCIALVLVEQALPVLPAPPLASRLREKLQAMQEQQKPAGAAGAAGGAAHD